MEQQLLDEIAFVMRVKGITQKDFADHKKTTRQNVNPIFNGRSGVLTGMGKDLLEFLGVKIKLEMIEPEKE